MYRQTKNKLSTGGAKCDKCDSTSILYQSGNLICRNCGKDIFRKPRRNKYNARKTKGIDGIIRDSMFESSVADELYALERSKAILGYDSQFKVQIPIYRKDGSVARYINWKIDFRVHNNDKSYTLLEAKGMETTDYKYKRDLLIDVWLPENPDYELVVRKQKTTKRYK